MRTDNYYKVNSTPPDLSRPRLETRMVVEREREREREISNYQLVVNHYSFINAPIKPNGRVGVFIYGGEPINTLNS